MKTKHHRQGMFIVDAIIGMMIVIAATAGIVAIAGGQRRAAIQSADMRAAVREAEAALTCLQSGQPIPSDTALRQLDTPAPAGWVWTEATGIAGSRKAVLIGLVPLVGGQR